MGYDSLQGTGNARILENFSIYEGQSKITESWSISLEWIGTID